MRRLRGADAYHLYKETRSQHMHTIKVQVLESAAPPLSFEDFKRGFERGIAAIPPFHWQLVKVPGNFYHPLWRYIEQLDVDYHVRRAAAPAPGGDRELAEVISEIASTGLERDRPLWQVWRIEGLAGGRIAYVTKLHHAIADGMSSAQILLDAFDPDPAPRDAFPHLWHGHEAVPPRRQLVRDALRELTRTTIRTPRLIGRLLRILRIGAQRTKQGHPPPWPPFSGGKTRFNRTITPHRWYAHVRLPVSDMKRVKSVLGGTINDVFVAVCAASLRSYLQKHGELPSDFPLSATIPTNIRTDAEKRTYGNRTGSWSISLATNEPDPLVRYRSIVAGTRAARDNYEAKDPALIADSMDWWWLHNLALGSLTWLMNKLTGRPPFHVVLSNVKGPSEPVYSQAGKVVELLSMGPIVDHQALNLTGWSYCDTMMVGAVSCREHVPDIWEIAHGVEDGLRELLTIVELEERRGQRRTAASGVAPDDTAAVSA